MWWHPRVRRFYKRHTWTWFWDGVGESLCSYGESVWRVVGWMAVLLLVWGLGYWYFGGVRYAPDGPISTDIRDAFLYALASFVTMEAEFIKPASATVEAFSKIQAALGIFLVGLLGFVAGNKIRRS